MMKKRYLILLGVLFGIFFAIALLPAKLVLQPLADRMTVEQIQIQRIGGTVWDGFVLALIPATNTPLVVRWDLKAFNLLMGELAVTLGVEARDFQADGSGFYGLGGMGVSSLNGDVQARILKPVLEQRGLSLTGALVIENVSVSVSDQRITHADGKIFWSGGRVKLPPSMQAEPLDLPGINAVLLESEGNLLIPVSKSNDNALLGEFALLLDQGLYSVKVLQRAVKLTGVPSMDGQADDDKVLFRQQQPLPF